MTSRRLALLVALLFVPLAVSPQSAAPPAPWADEAIHRVLRDRIAATEGVGLVVGLIDASGRRILADGHRSPTEPVTPETVFEIGSVTKVFTSLLLADMVAHGEVALNDPVAKYLPAGTRVPDRGGRVITLEDLASHRSALPRLPDNLAPADAANPYADYTAERLYRFLAQYQLPRDIGAQYEYSNLGGGLLGHALARRAGTTYEALVRARICDPLGMTSTRVELSPELQARLAIGHDAADRPTANWNLSVLEGAGGLRSTAGDLLRLLSAAMGDPPTPLQPALQTMVAARHDTGVPQLSVGLAWHIFTRSGLEIVWHNGATGGYRSFVGFDARARRGVVVLSNTTSPAGAVDDIGLHLLDPAVPLTPAPSAGTATVAVAPAEIDRYTGKYQFAPGYVLTVTRDGTHLFAQMSGQDRFEVYAEGDGRFFYKVVEARLTFVTNGNGPATAVVLHQNGADMRAERK